MIKMLTRLKVCSALIAVLITVGAVSGFVSIEAWFAPKAELWPRWQTHDASAIRVIDHSLWQAVLSKRVRPGVEGINLVDYGGMTDRDDTALDRYLDQMSHVAISTYNRNEQRAFWINVYNAATIALVRRHYPLKSIQNIEIGSGLFTDGAWDHALFEVEGEKLSLNDIEHRILRPIWRDPRLHYALNCASKGCPNLLPTAFTGANTEQLLNDGAVAYINHQRSVMIANNGLRLSKLYLWFAEDFGSTNEAILNHIRTYAFADLGGEIDAGRVITDYAYDWSLNE